MNEWTLEYTAPELQPRLQALRQNLSLPEDAAEPEIRRWLLRLTPERLELQLQDQGAPGPVHVDFVNGKVAHRQQFSTGRKTPLAKAIGLKQGVCPGVIDATAGMGKDAFLLASLGCQVLMIEQSSIIHALLEDGLQRARADQRTREVASRLTLVHANAIEYLDSCIPADVIYLDPMYPHRQKSALSKKDMQLLQQLVGADRNSSGLLHSALRHARQRVVVKRPARAAPIEAKVQPSFHCASPKTRYDVYLT